jgi:hypothetical protein
MLQAAIFFSMLVQNRQDYAVCIIKGNHIAGKQKTLFEERTVVI